MNSPSTEEEIVMRQAGYTAAYWLGQAMDALVAQGVQFKDEQAHDDNA